MTLKTLAEEEVRTPVACLVLLATPLVRRRALELRRSQAAGRHGREAGSRAATCALEHGGHQFGNDLGRVAADIRGDSVA